MGGLFAVLTWPSGGTSEPGDRAKRALAEILAARPQAPWENIERASLAGGESAVIETRGAPDEALDSAALQVHESRLVAVVASHDASTLARRLATDASGRSFVHPFPHAAMVWDGTRLDLHLDPLGTWPLYIRRLSWGVAAGTAALPLARMAPCADLDPEGVAELLTLGQLLGLRTLYRNIDALPRGARFRLTAESTTTERMVIEAPSRDGRPARSLDQAADAILAALDESVHLAPPSLSPGLLLSGGLDSRLLLAVLARRRQPVTAFTFGEPGCADERLARRVTNTLGVPHRVAAWRPASLVRVLDHAVALTDGQVSALHFHGLDLVADTRAEVSVQWNGWAGDAVLGGSFVHPRYGIPGPTPLESRLFTALNTILHPDELGTVLAAGPARDLGDHPRIALAGALARVPGGPAPERARRFLLDQRVGRLAALGLALDRHYVPVLTPYAHGPVLHAMTDLTVGERRFGRALARVLVRHFPELAAVPWQRTGARPGTPWLLAAVVRAGGRLWTRAVGGRGSAMADYRAWLDGPLADLRASLLRSASLCDRPLFDAGGLERLAQTRVQSTRDAALAGILMSVAVAAEILDGTRPLVHAIEPEQPSTNR